MRGILYKIIIMLLIGILLISSFFIWKNKLKDRKQEKIFEEIYEISKNNNDDINDIDDILDDTEPKGELKTQNNLTKENYNKNIENSININIKNLLKINTDTVGWIRIENTNINYPVMQTKNDPNYYLKRNFYKKYSRLWYTIYSRIL